MKTFRYTGGSKRNIARERIVTQQVSKLTSCKKGKK